MNASNEFIGKLPDWISAIATTLAAVVALCAWLWGLRAERRERREQRAADEQRRREDRESWDRRQKHDLDMARAEREERDRETRQLRDEQVAREKEFRDQAAAEASVRAAMACVLLIPPLIRMAEQADTLVWRLNNVAGKTANKSDFERLRISGVGDVADLLRYVDALPRDIAVNVLQVYSLSREFNIGLDVFIKPARDTKGAVSVSGEISKIFASVYRLEELIKKTDKQLCELSTQLLGQPVKVST